MHDAAMLSPVTHVFIVQDVNIHEGEQKVTLKAGDVYRLKRDLYEALRQRVPRHLINLTPAHGLLLVRSCYGSPSPRPRPV